MRHAPTNLDQLDPRMQRRLRRKLHHLRRRLEHLEAAGELHDQNGEPMHDHHERFARHLAHHARGGGRGGGRHPGRGGGRHRARRGAIVEAVLLLLDERPMHGYELITELEARSDGRWRPSAGTMYPALNRMEERGLLVAEEVDDKKRFSLSEAGRERLVALRDERDDDAPPPWREHASGGRGDLRRMIGELVGRARQIGRFGTPEQIDAARDVFEDARKRLDAIIADGEIDATPSTGHSTSVDDDAGDPDPTAD